MEPRSARPFSHQFAKEHQQYLQQQKRQKYSIFLWRTSLVIGFFVLWELAARLKLIDTFLFSCPYDIFLLLIEYLRDGSIFKHIAISVWETILGFLIGTVAGVFLAIILWWFEKFARIMDPILVVLNALPKTALAPIVIVWIGAGIEGIIAIAVFISIIVTVLSAYSYFQGVESEKIRLLLSFGANKWQLLTKLILPANLQNLVSILKINLGLSWVGVIVGEFLVSRYGIGYLIVYGSQVFRLDLVMMGVFVLAFCAWAMYEGIALFEKCWNKSRAGGNNTL